jgi:hypothetical protein
MKANKRKRCIMNNKHNKHNKHNKYNCKIGKQYIDDDIIEKMIKKRTEEERLIGECLTDNEILEVVNQDIKISKGIKMSKFCKTEQEQSERIRRLSHILLCQKCDSERKYYKLFNERKEYEEYSINI